MRRKSVAKKKNASEKKQTARNRSAADRKNDAGKKTAYCAVLVALAMIFSYVEAMLPIHFGVPGVKLGLANLVIVTGFYYLHPGEVLAISLVRILLTSLLFGNGFSLIYSLAGGVLSFLVMLGLKKADGFSVVGVSISGGVSHNIGQITVAALVVKNGAVLYYVPVLIAAGVLTGLLMGILAARVLPVIRKSGMERGTVHESADNGESAHTKENNLSTAKKKPKS